MSMPPRFETARETAVISKILADLVRSVQLIEREIEAKEERASVSDRSDVKYPMLARALIERRDNLKMTIDALERRLAELPKDTQIVAYCRGPYCLMSYDAVALLRKRGIKARRLEAGLPEWRLAGLPVERH